MNDEYYWTIEVHPTNPDFPEEGKMPLEMYAKVLARFPEHSRARGEYMRAERLPDADPRVHELLAFLKEVGAIIPVDRTVMREGVSAKKYKLYDEKQLQKEIDQAPLLEVNHDGLIIAETSWLPDGMPYVINEPRLRKQRAYEFGHAYAWNHFMMVRGQAKKTLESSGLKGLKLLPLELKDKPHWQNPQTLEQWPEGVEPLFLVWSDVELPPVRNWLFDNEGRVFPSEGNRGPFTDGCMVLEGPGEEYRWHYRKSEIDALGDFDIAHTYERHGSKEPCGPLLVVSQKFRRVMRELGFKTFRYRPHYADAEPWLGGVDGPVHPRLSGPPPADPKPPC